MLWFGFCAIGFMGNVTRFKNILCYGSAVSCSPTSLSILDLKTSYVMVRLLFMNYYQGVVVI